MDQKQAIELARQYVSLANEVMHCKSAVMFGSYAAGNPREDSDIDIGLFVERWDDSGDYLDLMARLYRLAAQVNAHIEPHVFVEGEDPSGLGAEARKTGIPVRG